MDTTDGTKELAAEVIEAAKKPGLLERFKIWLLRVLKLCTLEEHNNVCSTMRVLYETQIDGLNARVAFLEAENTDLKDRLADANEHIEALKCVDEENLEYVKNTQKALGELMAKSPDFKFPNNVPIPGSAAITSFNDRSNTGEQIVSVRSRTIALDDLTAEINRNPDMRSKFRLLIGEMRKRGLMDHIADYLLRAGAMRLVLAYNEDCTNYELYTEITAKNYAAEGATLVIHDPRI